MIIQDNELWQGGWNIGKRWLDVARWNELFPPWKKEHNSDSHWTPNYTNWPASIKNSCWGLPVFKQFLPNLCHDTSTITPTQLSSVSLHISPDIYIIILLTMLDASGTVEISMLITPAISSLSGSVPCCNLIKFYNRNWKFDCLLTCLNWVSWTTIDTTSCITSAINHPNTLFFIVLFSVLFCGLCCFTM